MTTRTTGDMIDEDEQRPADLSPAEQAAAEAAAAADKAAKKARKAQQKADRLAAEAQRLAGTDQAPAVEVAKPATGSRTPVIAAAAVLALCVAFLVVAVVVHVRGRDDTAQPTTGVRDAALIAARQDVVVLNSLDYRNIGAGLNRWLDVSTGDLHASFEHVTTADRNRIADAKAITTAHVLDAAMVSLDAANGHATVIASVELTVTPKNGKAVVKRERQRADVTLVGGVWKVSALQQVGVTVQ